MPELPPEPDRGSSTAIPASIPDFKIDTVDESIKKIKSSYSEKSKLEKEVGTLKKKANEERLKQIKDVKAKLPEIHRVLSRIPEVEKTKDNFVQPGESVEAKNNKSIEKKISSEINTKKVIKKTKVTLTKSQYDELKDKYPSLKNVPQRDLDQHLYARESTARETDLYRRFRMFSNCGVKTPNDFLSTNTPASGSTPTTTTTTVTPQPESSRADILKKVSSLLESLTSPETVPVLVADESEKEKAVHDDISHKVKTLEFSGGPADQPAFYDFFSLQIAFEHVWQELFDETLNDLVSQAYDEIVNNQIDLPEPPKDRASFMQTMKLYEPVFKNMRQEPPPSVIQAFGVKQEEWQELNDEQREALKNLVNSYIPSFSGPRPNPAAKELAENLIRYARDKINNSRINYINYSDVLKQIEKRLKEKYSFSIFAANEKERSVNFGIVLNYRQKWTPLTYQVGELVQTCPLAPKEFRKFSKKTVTKRSQSEKNTSSTSSKQSLESSDTSRAESEVIDKAMKKVSSNISAKAGYKSSWSPWSFSVEASHSKEASAESSQAKKDFREAVVKSSQELKNERSVEVTMTDSVDIDAEESGEISNPNDEITVTYLFYELQRRYRVSEFLNRVSPVVLVAQEVPSPDQIDKDWIICYEWILSQVLLDQSFQPALFYLTNKVVGDEFALQEQKKTLELQREMVTQLKEEFEAVKNQLGQDYKRMRSSIEDRIEAAESRHHNIWRQMSDRATGKVQYLDIAKMREEASREQYDRILKDEREMRARMERELTALQAASDSYTKALSDHLNRVTEIEALQVHLKENILYYMQAIWAFEPADQRYFRLYKTRVPVFTGSRSYSLTEEPTTIDQPGWDTPSYTFEVHCNLDTPIQYKTLVEVADVDRVLGFKGNYMIFPLKESNALTDFLMAPYVNKYSGIADPDPAGNWTLDDFSDYVDCLKSKLAKNEISAAQFESYKPALAELYMNLITDPLRENEEIVIPTKSLYIEALPGSHSILENFKLMHRLVDVKKVQAEVRYAELENLRGAARLVADDLEDPNIEKKIVIEGNGNGLVTPVNDN